MQVSIREALDTPAGLLIATSGIYDERKQARVSRGWRLISEKCTRRIVHSFSSIQQRRSIVAHSLSHCNHIGNVSAELEREIETVASVTAGMSLRRVLEVVKMQCLSRGCFSSAEQAQQLQRQAKSVNEFSAAAQGDALLQAGQVLCT